MTNFTTDRKLHMCFRLVPKSVTLDDLERPLRSQFQRRSCSPVTVVSRNLRFVRIFVGSTGSGRQTTGVIERRFSVLSGATSSEGTLGNKANIIIQYYLVPCRLSPDPKIRDLELP